MHMQRMYPFICQLVAAGGTRGLQSPDLLSPSPASLRCAQMLHCIKATPCSEPNPPH
jgi:hypothetical protein